MRQVIKLTESDLHKIIKESVKKILREGWNSNLSPDALDDKAYMNDLWDEREKMMQDDWERKNIAIRKKYPGKSREWYDAMLDTFYENRMNSNKAINEAHGEPDPRVALIYDSVIEDYQAQEIADEYGLSEEEAAAEWFKEVGGEMDIAEDEIPLHREFVMDIPELDAELYHDYGAGYYFLVKNDNKQDMPGFEGTWDSLDSLTNPFNENTIKEDAAGGGATNCASAMQTGCGNAAPGTNPEAGQYVVPFGPDKDTKDRHPGFSVDGKAKGKTSVISRPIYNPKSGKKK